VAGEYYGFDSALCPSAVHTRPFCP
jgi:hypothetical protein